MKVICLHLPEGWLRLLDELAESKRYQSNRSDVIRVAIRSLLKAEGKLEKRRKNEG